MKSIRYFILSILILSSCAVQALAYYHPDEGRWISRDPIGEQGALAIREKKDSSQELSHGTWLIPEHKYGFGPYRNSEENIIAKDIYPGLYLFVHNNPVGRIDPTGLEDVETKVEVCWSLFTRDPTTISHTYLRVEDKACGFWLKKFYEDGDWFPPWGTGRVACSESGGSCVNEHVDDCEIKVDCYEKCVKDQLRPISSYSTYNFFTFNCGHWSLSKRSACKESCRR